MTYEDAIKRAERAVEIAHHRYCEALEDDCRRPAALDIARRMLIEAENILTRVRARAAEKNQQTKLKEKLAR